MKAAIGRREGGSVDADIRKEALECEGGDLCLVDPICKLKQPRLLPFIKTATSGALLRDALQCLPPLCLFECASCPVEPAVRRLLLDEIVQCRLVVTLRRCAPITVCARGRTNFSRFFSLLWRGHGRCVGRQWHGVVCRAEVRWQWRVHVAEAQSLWEIRPRGSVPGSHSHTGVE